MTHTDPVIIKARPTTVEIFCWEPGCTQSVDCTIDVRVILEPNKDGRRVMYALGKPDTTPIWDHMLTWHGPADEEWDMGPA